MQTNSEDAKREEEADQGSLLWSENEYETDMLFECHAAKIDLRKHVLLSENPQILMMLEMLQILLPK